MYNAGLVPPSGAGGAILLVNKLLTLHAPSGDANQVLMTDYSDVLLIHMKNCVRTAVSVHNHALGRQWVNKHLRV